MGPLHVRGSTGVLSSEPDFTRTEMPLVKKPHGLSLWRVETVLDVHLYLESWTVRLRVSSAAVSLECTCYA